MATKTIDKILALDSDEQRDWLSKRLKSYRLRRRKELGRKVTQDEIAVELSLTVGTYINYEHGHRFPQRIVLEHLIEKTKRNGTNGKQRESASAAVSV